MKLRNTIAALIILLCLSQSAGAQTVSAVVGSGFTPSVPINIAPGALTTVFVQGLGTSISSPVFASSSTLPTKLGGISVVLKQTELPLGPIPVPILAIFPVAACRSSIFQNCGHLTGINVQIPFELVPNPSLPDPFLSPTNYAQLIISEDGGSQATVEATPVTDRIHVLRLGDTLVNPAGANPDRPISALRPIVTHSDGTFVSAGAPAIGGESLTVWAVGLGPVLPRIPSGEPTPNRPPTSLVQLSFDFRPDAFPSNPASLSSPPTFVSGFPTFSGLAPGFVGLYQINFVVPDLPSGYRIRCGNAGVTTNLTISIGRLTSFDGAGICVRIPGQP